MGQMGVQDHSLGCPHGPDKTSDSFLNLAYGASSVPQFPLSHHRLVLCILIARSGASALRSSGAAPQGCLGPAGDPGGAAGPLPAGSRGPAEPVQECAAGRVRHLATGGPRCGVSWGGSSPRQWDRVSGAGRHVQPGRDNAMELLRVLLALAGTGAAAGLGDSPRGSG